MADGTRGEVRGSGRSTSSRTADGATCESESVSGESFRTIYPLSLWRVRRFVPELRRISAELTVPEPARSRILLEMAADLEALYEHYRARGMDDEEAGRRAEAQLLAGPEALQGLILLHTTGYQRWVGRAAGGIRWGFDLLLFAAGVLPLVLVSSVVVLSQLREPAGGVALWLVLALGVWVMGIGCWKGWLLLVARERSPRRLHRGLIGLLAAGFAGPLIGGTAFLLSLVAGAQRLSQTTDDIAVAGFAREMVEGGTVFGLGILLTFAAGLIWYILVNRVARIEQQESAALLA